MSRYIDADKFIEGISKIHAAHKLSESEEMFFSESEIEALVECEPTADVVEVKHGYWKEAPYTNAWGKAIHMECSVCGEEFSVTENARPYERYCRNCGAKMDERKTE